MPTIGPLELGIVLVIALVIFGPKRLPHLGRSLGSGMREFKDGITGSNKDDDEDDRPSMPELPESAAQTEKTEPAPAEPARSPDG